MNLLRKTLLLALILSMVAAGVFSLPLQAAIKIQCPADTDGIDTDGDGNVANDHVCLHLAAGDGFVNMADGTTLYTFGFSEVPQGTDPGQVISVATLKAQFPAPTIQIKEGQKLFLTVTNVGMIMRPDLFDPHSVHFHGFANAASYFDGEPMSTFGVNIGSSFTYYYNVVDPGTYMYHCHVEATEHMQMGMLGNLYVTPKQDGTSKVFNGRTFTKFAYNDGDGSTGYDKAYPIQLHAFDPQFHKDHVAVQPLNFAYLHDKNPMINGRGYPDTINKNPLGQSVDNNNYASQIVHSLIEAAPNQRILLRVSNLSFDYYTLTALGIPMKVVGKDARLLRGPTGLNLYYDTTSVDLGGGESYDVLLDTTGVAPGRYFLYTTNLNYLSNDLQERGGMMTEIVIQ
jgi:FtsP/CotA-like multicopper oxidase with cupredoxin domain